MKRSLAYLVVALGRAYLFVVLSSLHAFGAASPTRVTIDSGKLRQEFQGLGCGAIFFEGHITSLAAGGKDARQRELYDDMFAKVPTRFLQLMIRHDHEPQNDNADPWIPAFDPANFKYCEHTLAIAKAARERRPDIQLFATLYTPPPWMKTNGAEGGGGQSKATLKPKLELELAEFVWAFLAQMARGGAPVQWLALANEPDWPHEQPGYFLTAERHAELFKTVADYLDKMAQKFPDVPRPKLVGPNTLSAPDAAKSYVPVLLRKAGPHLAAIASHDYDMRGDRWDDLQKLARGRPVWMSEWCSRGEDTSPGQINAALQYGAAMHEAFSGGANVWMAYDWVYPNATAGESLIHVDWGNDYTLRKGYWLFRQWAEPLQPGMRVISTAVSGGGAASIKPTAFLSADGTQLVVHVLNTSDKDTAIELMLTGRFSMLGVAERQRTSPGEDDVKLAPIRRGAAGFADTSLGRSIVTYRFGR